MCIRDSSRTGVTQQNTETEIRFNGGNDRLQCGVVHWRPKKELRIGSDAKGGLAKSEVPEKAFLFSPRQNKSRLWRLALQYGIGCTYPHHNHSRVPGTLSQGFNLCGVE